MFVKMPIRINVDLYTKMELGYWLLRSRRSWHVRLKIEQLEISYFRNGH